MSTANDLMAKWTNGSNSQTLIPSIDVLQNTTLKMIDGWVGGCVRVCMRVCRRWDAIKKKVHHLFFFQCCFPKLFELKLL